VNSFSSETQTKHARILKELRLARRGRTCTFEAPSVVVNPYGNSPLSALVSFDMGYLCKVVKVVVKAKYGGVDIAHTFDDAPFQLTFDVPVLGLYPNYTNEVEITITDGDKPVSNTIEITPEKLTVDIGRVDLRSSIPTRLNDDLYFVALQQSYPIAIDKVGDVRWVMTYAMNMGQMEALQKVNPNDPLEPRRYLSPSGGDTASATSFHELVEFDLMGRIYRTIPLPFEGHHDFVQISATELLMNSQRNSETNNNVEDMIAILPYPAGSPPVWEVDFKTILNPARIAQPPAEIVPGLNDWFHGNSVDYVPSEEQYVVSARHQNTVISIDRNQQIKWILGSHYQYDSVFQQYLLQPVNSSGQPIYDLQNPADSARADEEFWNWAQHAAKVIRVVSPGVFHLIMFNNGDYRSFDPAKHLKPYDNASEACIFEVNQNNKTVQKLWSYGRERGSVQYSSFVSNAIYIDDGESQSVAINFGGIGIDQRTGLNVALDGDVDMEEFPDTEYFGKKRLKEHVILMEVDYSTKEVLFDCKVENNEGGPLTSYAFKMRKFPMY
jgi:arylsulfate sulfotransferase